MEQGLFSEIVELHFYKITLLKLNVQCAALIDEFIKLKNTLSMQQDPF